MNTPWIKVRGDASTLTTFCERCGHSVTFTLPISVTDVAAMAKAFVAEHRDCKATSTAEPGDQSGSVAAGSVTGPKPGTAGVRSPGRD